MAIQTEKFVRKVRPVEAVQVTEDNIHEVAGWCGGLVVPPGQLGGNHTVAYVHVPVTNPRSAEDSKAFPEKWIIKEGGFRGGFRVVTAKQFKNSYELLSKPKSGPSPKAMPQKKSINPKQEQSPADPSGLTEPTPEPQQTGATEVEVNRSAITGQFVSDETAEQNPDTTVTETVEKKENDVQDNNELNAAVEASTDDLVAAEDLGDGIVPGDMVDPEQPEEDEDGTVQLGAPTDEPAGPELCGQCGSQVVDGVCSNDIDHDVNGTAEPVSAPRILPGN